MEELGRDLLLRLEHPKGGIHWFTSYKYAAEFIGCKIQSLYRAVSDASVNGRCKRWDVTFTDEKGIIWGYINERPEKNPILNNETKNI